MGENVFKRCKQQGINIQNIQTAHATQCQKKKKNPKNQKVQIKKKTGRKSKQTFLQRHKQMVKSTLKHDQYC